MLRGPRIKRRFPSPPNIRVYAFSISSRMALAASAGTGALVMGRPTTRKIAADAHGLRGRVMMRRWSSKRSRCRADTGRQAHQAGAADLMASTPWPEQTTSRPSRLSPAARSAARPERFSP